jgi:hypothetical protein
MPLSHGEPTLEDLLCDPMVLALMKRDGVDPDMLRRLVRDIRRSQQALSKWPAAGRRVHHGSDAPV